MLQRFMDWAARVKASILPPNLQHELFQVEIEPKIEGLAVVGKLAKAIAEAINAAGGRIFFPNISTTIFPNWAGSGDVVRKNDTSPIAWVFKLSEVRFQTTELTNKTDGTYSPGVFLRISYWVYKPSESFDGSVMVPRAMGTIECCFPVQMTEEIFASLARLITQDIYRSGKQKRNMNPDFGYRVNDIGVYLEDWNNDALLLSKTRQISAPSAPLQLSPATAVAAENAVRSIDNLLLTTPEFQPPEVVNQHVAKERVVDETAVYHRNGHGVR